MAEVTLRDLVQEKFENVNRRLDDLTRAIEELAKASIREERFQSTVHKVEDLQALMRQLDDRVDEAESQIRIYKYVGSVVVAIVVAVAAALVKSWLGV